MTIARQLSAETGARGSPPLLFLTDPARTPDPVAIAARLPAGAGVIYRHFGAADRRGTAAALAAVCRTRGLALLIAADPDLAMATGAAGVHWPERLIPGRRHGFPLETAATHGAEALARAARAGLDAALLSPVFPSRSAPAGRPLGPMRAAGLAQRAGLPVYALGGVNARSARRLKGLGFSGIAAVGAIAGA
ncbi:MAG: thiamine monophosphate synthase [Alphaproteobacteria bacterium]|nr:thiamine monophosphate synthase [Alphaproteobacteria bacterium]